MSKPTTIINLGQVVKSFSGSAIKDMIESNDPKKSKDLTIGSLIGNGFMLGLEDTDKKLALKVFQLAGELQDAIERNDGKYEVDIDTIDLLEEY